MDFTDFVLIIGLLLVALGAASGFFLLRFALGHIDIGERELNIATLWGLFVSCLMIGMLLTWVGWP